jgi:hypothetical protein
MESKVTRREFSVQAALLMLGGAAITISGCGGGGGSSNPAGPSLGPGDKAGSVSANHGHTAVITAAQLSAGGALNLGIRGSSNHPHSISLSASQVSTIASGGRVSVTSTVDDAHDHTVTFN